MGLQFRPGVPPVCQRARQLLCLATAAELMRLQKSLLIASRTTEAISSSLAAAAFLVQPAKAAPGSAVCGYTSFRSVGRNSSNIDGLGT